MAAPTVADLVKYISPFRSLLLASSNGNATAPDAIRIFPPADAQLFAMAQRLKDKPNEKVSIYRATLLYPNVIYNLSHGSKSTFDKEILQCERQTKLKDYYNMIQTTVSTFRGNYAKDKGVRLWKCPSSEDPLKALYSLVKK